MSLWRHTLYSRSNLLYSTSYNATSRRLASSSASWFWLRTQVGYFSIAKGGGLRKTNFSGGTPRAQFCEINNNDGTISYQVSSGKFKDYFISLDGDRVGLDKTNKANLIYDSVALTLTYRESESGLNNSELYVNTNTGYFYFGFDELFNKDQLEKERWANPKGIEKLALTPDGWQKKVTDGYAKCALRYETEIKEHSAGII
eukprot:UN01244